VAIQILSVVASFLKNKTPHQERVAARAARRDRLEAPMVVAQSAPIPEVCRTKPR